MGPAGGQGTLGVTAARVVGLTLSLRRNGDMNVFVDDQVLDQLLAALDRAKTLIAKPRSPRAD